MRDCRDGFACRAVHRYRIVVDELGYAAHVIAVVMCAQDRYRRQPQPCKGRAHRRGFAWIDDCHAVARVAADQPDVVVLEGWDV